LTTATNGLKAYIASPLGFSEVTDYFMREVYIPRLRAAGIVPNNPWALTSKEEVDAVMSLPPSVERNRQIRELHREIAQRNKIAIVMAPILIAQLDGQEMDSGTVAEVAYAVGRGKVVFGYRSDFRKNGEEGAMCNLQVQYFIEDSGGRIFTSLEELIAELTRFKKLYDPS